MIIDNYKQLAREIARAQGIEPPPEPPMPLTHKIVWTVIGIAALLNLIGIIAAQSMFSAI